ncbi:MAG: flagellar biosynthesis protein FlhA [Stappia sp.]|uniref:flagellar biosynthesis protein FlhA n=1 Tax=Stappia sp. TaxID=1870903 RepID=UPI000C512685|nr:flagellar biosynthesis protein FlhA [Stappia sp.]MAB00651.1 flagellar biosynthesis protein FlhA [Stappia sp.]MBM18721.1 flagellar biosynthesis protein FlhA [Stappia sp.]
MSDVTAASEAQAPVKTTGASARSGGGLPGLDLAAIWDTIRRGDIALALGVMVILVVLILPMPAMMLDLFLAVSIIFSVLILMTGLFIQKPLEFSSFPTVLLIATMMRLALNLASTRLILANGHEGTDAAGQVIQAFGNFVMGGNFVIGIIVFSILVIVNFVVITKGSGRIAEVAARFTLDAMPGKQMAIDADLSAGLIDETVARQRRKDLEDESSFFGAMDGASKFVRGDAIAGLLITFINIVAGIIIGVAQMELTFSQAATTYTLLTIGDGLVSQIPALVVSTAAGLLVSKAGVSGAADKALGRQLSGYPKALGMSSFVMVVLAMLPGIPLLPFLGMAGLAGYLAYTSSRKQTQAVQEAEVAAIEAAAAEPPAPTEPPITESLKMDELRIELGYALLPLINGQGAESDQLTEQIKALRRQLASDLGILMPPVRILDNIQLGANDYVIKVKEVAAGNGQLFPGHFMVMDPAGGQVKLPGTHTTEPTFGLPATWVEGQYREDAALRGYTVVDPATVLATHLTETIRANVSELITYADVQKLLKEITGEQAKLVEDLVPGQITVSGIQRVLQALLAERVSVRDLGTILEGIAEAVGFSRNPATIAEHVRTRLARQISAANTAPGGYLPLIALSPQWEQAFIESLSGEGDDRSLAMAPSRLQEFVRLVRDAFEQAAQAGEVPVLLTSPQTRPFVRSIVERFRAHTTVMSQNEVHSRARLKTVGTI